ncbi:ABC transporter ATP-binding protein [Desulfogranum japonicum]|uniref:ABC transporter ATP-binding protein n=1 Tax=Desulfogranum japonicum TaxID=231447 RepID=UPI0004024C38|nr:ABC transporter ATP-binding protein [Desulfogranum japonicum]
MRGSFGYTEKGEEGRVNDFGLWRRILTYCRRYKIPLAVAVLLSFVVTFCSLMLPRIMQEGIDGYMAQSHLEISARILGLQHLAVVYGVLVCCIFLTNFVQIVLLEWIGQSVMHKLRKQLFDHLVHLDLAFFNEHRAGQLVTRLTNDIQNMHEMFTSVMVTLFNDALKLVGIFCLLYLMNARLALLMTLFVPLAFFITRQFAHYARKVFRQIRSQLAKINSFLAEALQAIDIIQLFGRHDWAEKTYTDLTDEYLQRNLKQVSIFGFFMPLTELMSSGAVALILWYGGGEVLRSRLSLGELVAFLSYMRLFFQPLRELSQKYSIVQSAMASAERIFHLLDTKSHLHFPVWKQAVALDGDVNFSGIVFGYSASKLVFNGLDLHIKKGESVALVGSTGAGKTTLIQLLARFYDPHAGNITLNDVDIRTIPLPILRQTVGLIMQDIFILPGTVQENIILDQPLDKEKLDRILQQTGLEVFIGRLSNGLQTQIGEGFSELSVGEKQLLSFVRALYRDPVILVLDEATASIDTESENLLEEAVAAGFSNKTSLIIAHRLSTVRRVDRIVVMDQGRIVEQGSHEELMSTDSLYSNLVTLDLKNSMK